MKKLLALHFLFMTSLLLARTLPLPWSPPVHWASLERYNMTITAEELKSLLSDVYVPDGSWKSWITISRETAFIEPYPGAPERLQLALAPSREAARPRPRYWKEPQERVPLPGKPLAGLTIALDPGHLGGSWAKMEERWFRLGKTRPIEEGTMTLLEARLLAKDLRALGAHVLFTRDHLGPTTPLRPWQLRRIAIEQLKEEGHSSWTSTQLKKREEILFYRIAEIHHRAQLVNEYLKPDLVLALHFDAEEWGDPAKPQLKDSNRFHLLVSGNFTDQELKREQERYILLRKLLGRVHQEEVGIADAIAKAFLATAEAPPPPFIYHNPQVARPALPSSPYLWNRNLLATRLMEAPVIFIEAYSMNDPLVFQRLQWGDYQGTRLLGGKAYPSIYREYAQAIEEGLLHYFSAKTPPHSLKNSCPLRPLS